MADLARRNGARYWLQQADPQDAVNALKAYPEARCIVIEREFYDTMKSTLKMWENYGRGRSFVNAVLLFVMQEKLLARITRSRAVHRVQFERLKADTESEVRAVCGYLSIPYEEGILTVQFRQNTSFRSAAERDAVLTPRKRLLCGALRVAFRAIPLWILQVAWYFRSARKMYLTPGSYGLIRDKFDLV